MGAYGDHPRTRGEKIVLFAKNANFSGSPPHTRGKDISTDSEDAFERITPAHAGKSVTAVILF